MSKRLLTAALAAVLPQDLGLHQNPHGIICAANENRFTSGHYSEPLTALTIGWKDPEDVDGILQRLFPEIKVARRFEFKKAINAEAFLSESDDIRSIGAAFKKVKYTGQSQSSRTINKGLTVSIDHDETDDLEGEVQATIGRLQSRLARNDLRRGLALLEANDVSSGILFNKDTNPDGLVRAQCIASTNVTGVRPNVIVYGEAAWELRLDAYEDPAREQPTNRADKTFEELARYFMVDRVEVVKARYQSTATAKATVFPSSVYAYLAEQGAGKDDPSAVKRFMSAGRAGQRFGVYRVEHEKFTDISIEHYSNLVVTGLGIETRTVAAA